MGIEVLDGDITQLPADAMLTLVNGGGRWKGGVDEAIRRVAGEAFHA